VTYESSSSSSAVASSCQGASSC